MSHTMTMPQAAPFNWRRSSAISATMAFHLGVLVLLFMPPVLQQLAPAIAPDPITVVIKEPEVLPKPIEDLKPPPPPKKHEIVKVKTPPPPIPQDVVVRDEPSPMARPMSDVPPGPSIPTDITPQDTAPTPMGYGTRHAVAYPKGAVKNGEQGKVVLKVLIGTDGMPQRIEIAESSGHSLLDRAARDAVLKWRFTPGTKNGAPYEAWAMVPIEFHLDKT
jgi:protein TonB